MVQALCLALGKLPQDLYCFYKVHLKHLVRDFKMYLISDNSQANNQNNVPGVLRVVNTNCFCGIILAMFWVVGELIE